MQRTPARLTVLSVLLATACSTDSSGPTLPEPGGPDAGFLVNGPKGYGFTVQSGDFASVILDGTHFRRCTDSDEGQGEFTLQVTQRMVDEMWDVLDQGGTVTIEAITYHRFSGAGDLTYSEQISVSGPGVVSGSFSNTEQVSWPGYPAQTYTLYFEQPVTRNDMTGVSAGGTITVSGTAQADGDLGGSCGEIVGGHAYWKMRGAVLRLVP